MGMRYVDTVSVWFQPIIPTIPIAQTAGLEPAHHSIMITGRLATDCLTS